MSDVVKSVLVPYTPAEMFVLVDHVEDYPQFLPWCGRTELHERNDEVTEATLHIDYHRLRQSFTTRNQKLAPHEMHIRLKSGPFRRMDGGWRFHPLGEPDAIVGCKIEFKLHYEFANSAFDALLSPVFGYIAGSLVDSFIQRAEQVYGAR